MLETLKTLRLVHMTLLGLSAAVVMVGLSRLPDFAAAIRDLEDLRAVQIDGEGSFYEICDKEAKARVGDSRKWVEAFLSAPPLKDSVDLAPGFVFETFGFCEGPPLNGTLEAYERFVLRATWVEWPVPDQEELAKVLTPWLKERAERSSSRATLESMTCSHGRFAPQAPLSTQWEWFRKSRSIMLGAHGTPPTEVYLGLQFRRADGEAPTRSTLAGAHCKVFGGFPAFLGRKWLRALKPQLISPVLAARTPAAEYEIGPRSADLFPRLRPFWSTIRTMTIDGALAHLENEQSKSATQLTLLGLSLPTTTVAWGIPLVTLVVLLYLSVNLTHALALAGRDGNDLRTFPWIALYPDRVSWALTYLSVAFVPLAANLLLFFGPRQELLRQTTAGNVTVFTLLIGCSMYSVVLTLQMVRLRATARGLVDRPSDQKIGN